MCHSNSEATEKQYAELEKIKVDYLKHCFKSATEEQPGDSLVDGDSFLNSL